MVYVKIGRPKKVLFVRWCRKGEHYFQTKFRYSECCPKHSTSLRSYKTLLLEDLKKLRDTQGNTKNAHLILEQRYNKMLVNKIIEISILWKKSKKYFSEEYLNKHFSKFEKEIKLLREMI